jgi:hypothetical protein
MKSLNELGRGDRVLALLTEGEPRDSFPTAMLAGHREMGQPDGATRVVEGPSQPLAAAVRPRSGVSPKFRTAAAGCCPPWTQL